MFNKNIYLELLENLLKDKVLYDFITFEYDDVERGYFDVNLMLREDPTLILDIAEIKNKDFNYLTATVVQYGKDESYIATNNLKLPFIVNSMVEKGNFAKNYDDKKFLASLIYLLNTDNKYQELAVKVLYNYVGVQKSRVSDETLSLLKDKNRLVAALTKLETITTLEDYVITDSDIELLEELKYNSEVIKEIPMIKVAISSVCNVDYSLLAKFLNLDGNNYKYKNNYFNAIKVIEDVKKKEYSIEELRMLKLLKLNTLITSDISIFDCLDLKISSKRPNFLDVLEFVKLYDKYNEGNDYVNFNRIIKALKLTVISSDVNSYYYDDASIFKKIYKEYRKQNFSFNLDEFCNYINRIKKEKFLEEKIRRYKSIRNSSNFDMYSFIYLIGSVSKCYELNIFAPYIPYLIETESGKKYFSSMLEKEKLAVKKLEEIYTNDTLARLLPLAYNLASMNNYEIGSYAKKYVYPEDYLKFKAVCGWLRKKDKNIFKNSIDNHLNKDRDRERAIKEATDYFSSLPLKEINYETINKYYKSLELPYLIDGNRNHVLGMLTINNIAHCIYKTKVDNNCLVETKKLLLLLDKGESIIKYIDTRDYSYTQVLDIITSASEKIDDKKALTSLYLKLREEIANKEEQIMLDEALELVNILKDSKFSSFSDFNNYVLEEYGISKTKQKMLFDMARKDEKLANIIMEKEVEIREKQSIKRKENAVAKAKEKLDYNIDKYGEEAVKAMRTFIETDAYTIRRFCKTSGISEKDFKFYRNLCAEIDKDLTIEVNDKCRETSRKFISFIIKCSREIALEMKRCHKEKVPYDLYHHYEKYGVSPFLIANMSSRFDRLSESKLINQYMTIHKDIFIIIGVSRLEGMKRRTSVYNGTLFMDNNSISYNKKDIEQAVTDLSSKGIPLYNGTFYQALIRMKKDAKTLKKVYNLEHKTHYL